jgi:dolichol kinase
LGDLARFAIPALNRLFFRVFRLFASPREREGVASSTWYAIGVLLVFVLLPPSLAACSVLVLALADPTASYLGRRWGRRRVGTGTVLGSASFLLVAYLVLTAFVGPWRALPVAALVTVAELSPWRVDDNLVVPLATALGLWIVTTLL